jgi:hypothetical protein
MYTPEEAQRIFTMYREMIYQAKTPSLSREEFAQKVPEVLPFQQSNCPIPAERLIAPGGKR